MQFCQIFNLIDKVAAVLFHFENISLGEELAVGQFCSAARHMKTRRQGPGRREALSRLQRTASNLAADIFVNLPVERLLFITIETDI